jgi:hypothetical protein
VGADGFEFRRAGGAAGEGALEMARIAQEAIEYEIKRSLRPDWRRFWKPGHENDPLYKLYESVERKFDPNQARVPKGQPEGGQWASDGTSDAPAPEQNGTADVQTIISRAKKLAAMGGLSYQTCLNLCYPILERFSRPGSDKNTFDFHKCMNDCLGK